MNFYWSIGQRYTGGKIFIRFVKAQFCPLKSRWGGLLVLLLVMITLLGRPAQPIRAQLPDELGGDQTTGMEQETSRVVVALRPPAVGVSLSDQAAEIAQTQQVVLQELPDEAFHLLHRYQNLPGMVGQTTAAGLDKLLARPEVWAVSPDLPVEAALAEGVSVINADDVWRELRLTGAGATVAILDTGIDTGHPDLAEAIVAEHCFHRNGGCPPGGESESSSAQDENGHGTHIAGIVAGRGQIAPRGIAPGAGIVAVRVLQANGSGYISDVLAGLDWVLANQSELNVSLVNMSLGGGRYRGVCDEADANTILYAAAVEAVMKEGITLFAASGNWGLTEQMMLPACLSGVVSVGSTYDADYDTPFTLGHCTDSQPVVDQVTCSSNSSSELDLLAPGVLITSTGLGGGTSNQSGSSMSTAHATGAAALMVEANPDLAPLEIETAMKETGLPVTDSRNGRITPRVDALAAVTQVAPVDLVTISGTVLLEGRTDHSGTPLFLSEAPCSEEILAGEPAATTQADGSFEIVRPVAQGYGCLQAVHSGYLVGQQSDPLDGSLGSITLPGGDVNQDNRINISDLALLASNYNTAEPTADVNASGTVDLLDLILVASNYKREGPVTWPDNN